MQKRKVKKLKVFGHPWHIAHQFSLSNLPFLDFDWLVQFKRPYSDKPRGDFMHNWVTEYQEGKYDFAILHLDQQCIEDEIWDRGKGSLYRQLNETIKDIPKIVIMHGTTYYPEKFSREQIVQRVKEIVGDNIMVVNSHQTGKDFGFGTPIIHGLDAKDWWDLPKEARVVTMISPGGLDKYYDRQFFGAVKETLEERDISLCHISVDWQSKDWNDYRNFLGRSLIYFNPAYDSCMPRSRTEAMLSGCCVITTPHQDAASFIKDGVNGFLCPRNPVWVADKIQYLLEHYDEAKAIGQAGKKTAEELFSKESYEKQWREFLEEKLNVEIEL